MQVKTTVTLTVSEWQAMIRLCLNFKSDDLGISRDDTEVIESLADNRRELETARFIHIVEDKPSA